MSRFKDANHEYDELCLDKLGCDLIFKEMEQQIEENEIEIKTTCHNFISNNKDYIIRNITDNLVIVITKDEQDSDDNQFLGYPFPFKCKKYSASLKEWFAEIKQQQKIYIRMFFRGSNLRIRQKEFLLRYLEQYGEVTWNNYAGNNLYDPMEKLCIHKRINKVLYVDPYAFIGDSVLGLTFADLTLDFLRFDNCLVFSKAHKHISSFYETYPLAIDLIEKKLEEYDLIICPDLLDNHFGRTLTIIRNLKLGCVALLIARNLIVEKTANGYNVFNLSNNDVLLLNSNIFNYMTECLLPFFKTDGLNKGYYGNIDGKANLFFINPFSSAIGKFMNNKFVDLLIHNLLVEKDAKIYISSGSGAIEEKKWLDVFCEHHKIELKKGNIILLHDKGLADLLKQLQELNIGFSITVDTGIANLLTRAGMKNITVYNEKFWDKDSLQSLSAESPIGFCSNIFNQLPIVIQEECLLDDYIEGIIRLCKHMLHIENIVINKEAKLFFTKYKAIFNDSKDDLYTLDFDLINNKYHEMTKSCGLEWMLRLYNPFNYCKNICKYGPISNNLIYSAIRVSPIYKILH